MSEKSVVRTKHQSILLGNALIVQQNQLIAAMCCQSGEIRVANQLRAALENPPKANTKLLKAAQNYKDTVNVRNHSRNHPAT